MEEKDMANNRSDIALTEMRLQFETMAEMQKEERLEMQRNHEKEIKHWKNICVSLVISLCLIISVIVGSVIYVLSNYEIAVGTYQDLYVGNNGNPIIEDGIHINDTAEN